MLNLIVFEIFQQKSSVDMEPKMSLADRMKILKEKEEQWKNKGKGAANDSVQFTVAGRMAKRGKTAACLFSPCGLTPVQASSLFCCDKSNLHCFQFDLPYTGNQSIVVCTKHMGYIFKYYMNSEAGMSK